MSAPGLHVAVEHGQELPAYPSATAARVALFQFRDDSVRRLVDLSRAPDCPFKADFSPESLKTLERWYFSMWDAKTIEQLGISAAEFESLIAVYFGAVAVRNSEECDWVVEEYAFVPGRYELGVRRGLVTIMLMRFKDLWARPNNKKRESVWREYSRFVS